ncbi:hypothetical protein HO133_000057 [Letharia lupina]|uniref:Lysine decarboxylase-like protein-like protein n=1 Tax=Letharia lupina TaxID=560253 RepID=A0A8H6CGM0_9LECA|nr:uncharacterized protein HO133_000057 [Letharia lupina]KAF6223215.1 hypothetical protein HO133_000057 [Letharia lupina]
MASEPSRPALQSSTVSRPASSSISSTTERRVICVFCGSSSGTSPTHLASAKSLGETFHKHNIHLVYGGGTVGMMGEIARTLVSLSGPDSVSGIIPTALVQFEQEGRPGTASAHNGCSIDENVYGRMTVVADMHTRKQLMAKKVMEGGSGSGFVALSGGYGTLEELMEVITWNQLGIHGMGIVVYNVEGYYDGLIQWVRTAVSAGFIAPGNAGILVEALDAEEVVRELKEYKVAEGRFKLDWAQK